MANKDVWIVFTKSSPLDGCSIDIDSCDYYFAEAYVPVDVTPIRSLDSIINKVKDELAKARLALTDVSKCIRYKEDEWSADTAPNTEVRKMAKKSLAYGAIEFSGFRSEEIQELYQYAFVALGPVQ
ncbi:MAG TPA: hypothetical protein VL995_05120 [Cellvibrio sp.]|nr:hypothetical protein [Cellvibrio sp.]